MNNWWILILFVCSFLLTGLCRLYALRVEMLDIPNARSSHTIPTPRGGGVGLVLTFLLGSLILIRYSPLPTTLIVGTLTACSLVAIVGFIDDHYHLSAILRLSVHVIASALLLSVAEPPSMTSFVSIDFPLFGLDYILLGIGLVWLLNLYNFMDGIDGIAAIEALSVIGAALLILQLNNSMGDYEAWLKILGIAVAGFLFWNWPPAKIFMGDAGSGFLGFVLGCFAILTSNSPGINIWTWVILLAVFIVDATVTLLRRLIRGDRFWMAHRSHAYQILARRYNSHSKVTIGVLFINILWLLPWAFLSTKNPSYIFICISISTLPLIILTYWVGAGTKND